MGREIRKVPNGWEHPKNDSGQYQPMFDKYYGDAITEWINNHNKWLEGKHEDQDGSGGKYKFFAQWHGNAPDVEYYRTEQWTDEQACCFQIYEDVSEGTPISPVFNSMEQMEKWIVGEGYSETAAKNFCSSGWVPSFTIQNGVIKHGIHTAE